MLVLVHDRDTAKKIIESGEGIKVNPCRLFYEESINFCIDMFLEDHYLSKEAIEELRMDLSDKFNKISFEDINLQIQDFIYEWYQCR